MRSNVKLIVFLVAALAAFPYQSFGQWTRTSMPDTSGILCLLSDSNYVFAGTTAGGVYASTDSGATWTQRDSGLGDMYVSGLAFMGANLFVGTDNGVYRSTNVGVSWRSAGLVNVNAGVVRIAVFDTTIFTITNCYCSADQYNLNESTDLGATWTQVWVPPSSYTSVYGINANDTSVFIGTNRNGIYYSTNCGTDWIQIDSAIGVMTIGVGAERLWAADSRGLEFSTNGGSTWDTLNAGLPSGVFINAIGFSNDNVFLGTYNASIFLLKEKQSYWSPVGAGLPDTMDVTSLAVSGMNLLAGTSRNLWQRPLSEMITAINDPPRPIASDFVLAQNYPNPFNPSTVISYQLPTNAFVKLKIYDVLGREIRSLVNGRESAGDHSVVLNADGLPSGVYFYRLEAGNYILTKKLTVLK